MNIRKPIFWFTVLIMITVFLTAGCQAKPNKNSAWEDALLNSTEPSEPQETEKAQKTEAEALYDYFAMTFYGGADRLYAAAPEDYWKYLAENSSFTFEQAKEYVDAYAAETVEYYKSTLTYNFALKFKTGKVSDVDEEVQSKIITALTDKYDLNAEKAAKVVNVEFFLSYGGQFHELYMYMLNYDGHWYPVLETVKNDISTYTLAVEQDIQALRDMMERAEEES